MMLATLAYLALSAPAMATWDLSVYATRYHGRTAANGRVYDHRALSVAANTYPLGAVLLIRHGGRSVRVRVTDRMDRRLGRRRLDLSGAAMRALDPRYDGTDHTAGILRRAQVWRTK